jgi:regulator of RNase E activity RraA
MTGSEGPGRSSQETLEELRDHETALIVDSLTSMLGGDPTGLAPSRVAPGGVPLLYSDPGLRCMFPEAGSAIGRVVTCEVTTSDDHPHGIEWDAYYDHLDRTPGPIFAVIVDVDSHAGRGAAAGDGMLSQHRMLGVSGLLVEGAIRDSSGMRRVGTPVWARGRTPGHGVFRLVRFGATVAAGGMRLGDGDLLVGDEDGVVRIPAGTDLDDLLDRVTQRQEWEAELLAQYRLPDADLARIRAYVRDHPLP